MVAVGVRLRRSILLASIAFVGLAVDSTDDLIQKDLV